MQTERLIQFIKYISLLDHICLIGTITSFLNIAAYFSQTSQGVQPKRFKKLQELVSLYLQPNQGLVTTLLYAVDREETAAADDRDYSGINQPYTSTLSAVFWPHLCLSFLDGEDEKPPLPPRSASTSTPPAAEMPTDR